ncbi:MAG: TIGR03915 family putative DNA repair protein [Treponema sp.]|jgi:probable DNA metabolism protein|nr:TIGR03915 family putative DNA repair protein [Treponema sp.]
MSKNLNKLFLMLENNEACAEAEEDLFGFLYNSQQPSARKYKEEDIELIAFLYSSGFNPHALDKSARRLFELSPNAFTAFTHAWMSELPIEAEMLSFGRKILAAQDHDKAEKVFSDFVDDDVRTVLNAARKVQFEVHRMYGLLRFFPLSTGIYVAQCAPDFLILPMLGEYFTARFGETPWAIIDEKRGLILSRRSSEPGLPLCTKIQVINVLPMENSVCNADEWEDLWRHYHKTINNESRNNPNLQRQLMPKRYWKYLPEV